jgi:predicted RNase H-like nuclease (RuvC/YqgF family)
MQWKEGAMSDTPRTDAEASNGTLCDQCVTADFARQLERELAEARNILKQCLSIMPVGYVPTHTVENLPEMIGDLAKALAEETTEREKLERELSDMTKRRDDLLASLEKVVNYLTISLPASAE